MKREVQHRPGAFFVELDGRRIAELTYAMRGSDAVAEHTWVDPKYRGRTLAHDLVEALAAWARAEGLKVVPVCAFVQGVFARDERYGDLRA